MEASPCCGNQLRILSRPAVHNFLVKVNGNAYLTRHWYPCARDTSPNANICFTLVLSWRGGANVYSGGQLRQLGNMQ